MAQNDSDKPKRLYQVWRASNRFFCGGRLIFGPDAASLFLSMFLIAAPAVVFFIKMYMKIKDKKTKHVQECYPILIVGLILTVADLLFLFMTSGRDPGIIPRNSRPPDADEGIDEPTPSMEWVIGRTPHLKLPRTKDVIVNGHLVKVKYCDTCLLYRPPRASHCSICNNCVQRFDHHCPWLGQCIGMRNYRFFFMFISTSTTLCIYIFVFSWINIIEKEIDSHVNIWRAMSRDALSVFLVVYCFVAVWFVGGLTVFHSYLICTNQTTYENFRYRYDKKDNPYSKGTLRNLGEIFFSKIPPSLNNFRSFVEEDEYMVVGPVTPNFGVDNGSSKEKIDIEMGGKHGENSAYPLPEILRNLNYDDLEENLEEEEEGRRAFDPYIANEQDVKELVEVTIIGDGKMETGQVSASGSGNREFMHSITEEDEVTRSVQISNAVSETDGVEKSDDVCNSHGSTAQCHQP
ncbi:hypothetical protein SLA2020_493800 [Shorea laevis]